MFGKRKIATLVAEFLGTGILTLLVLSVQRSSIGVPFFVAVAAGLTLVVLVFAFGSVSGAHTNPAITIAMWTARKISTVQAILYVAVQLLGGWAAYALYHYFVNTTVQSIGGHFVGRILVAEAVGAAILAFAWAAAVYQGYSRTLTAAVVGAGYTIAIIAASGASVGIANPAVALGVRAWVWGTYVLGPVLGAIIGVNLYGLLFASPEALAAGGTASAGIVSNTVIIEETVTAPAKKTRATSTRAKSTAKKTTKARSTRTTTRGSRSSR
jgi:glycerol uptake facilitator-like aquaporin